MSKHLNAIQRDLQGTSIRAASEAMGMAIALTESEIVTAKAKLFGAKLQRYPLHSVSKITSIPNPAANVLEIHFATTPPSSLIVMYNQDSQQSFRPIIAILEQCAAAQP